MEEGNTTLYAFRERLQQNRSSLQSVNEKYLKLDEKLDKLQTSCDDYEKKLNLVIDKQNDVLSKVDKLQSESLSYDNVKEAINEWSNAELQPVLNELADDMENCITEFKQLKQKQNLAFNSFNKMENDIDTQSVQSTKQSPQVKTLQLQKKTRL